MSDWLFISTTNLKLLNKGEKQVVVNVSVMVG